MTYDNTLCSKFSSMWMFFSISVCQKSYSLHYSQTSWDLSLCWINLCVIGFLIIRCQYWKEKNLDWFRVFGTDCWIFLCCFSILERINHIWLWCTKSSSNQSHPAKGIIASLFAMTLSELHWDSCVTHPIMNVSHDQAIAVLRLILKVNQQVLQS